MLDSSPDDAPSPLTPANMVAAVLARLEALLKDPGNPYFVEMGTWLAGVVLQQRHFDSAIDDVGYDLSTRPVATGEPFDLSRYRTVGEFLDAEAAGDTIATYVSGYGLRAGTWDDQACDAGSNAYRDLVEIEVRRLGLAASSFEEFYLDQADAMSDSAASETAYLHVFRNQPLLEVVARYLPEASYLAGRERERATEEARLRAGLVEQAAPVIAQINRYAAGRRFNRPNFRGLSGFLDRLSLAYGPAAVGTAIRHSRLNVSNSVRDEMFARYPEPSPDLPVPLPGPPSPG